MEHLQAAYVQSELDRNEWFLMRNTVFAQGCSAKDKIIYLNLDTKSGIITAFTQNFHVLSHDILLI